MSLQRALVSMFSLALLSAPVAEARSAKNKQEFRVTCKDGTTAKPGRGACGHHGGISSSSKSGPLCKDGVMVDIGDAKGCSKHGGIATKMDGITGKDDATVKKGDEKKSGDYRKADPKDRAGSDARDSRDTRKGKIIDCKDGTTATGRLGCFGHGGLADDARRGSGGDAPTGVNAIPEGATARCKDGAYSHARQHSGACSRHGGVEVWLDKK